MSQRNYISNRMFVNNQPDFDEDVTETETIQYTDPKTGSTRTVTKTVVKSGKGGNMSNFPGFDGIIYFLN